MSFLARNNAFDAGVNNGFFRTEWFENINMHARIRAMIFEQEKQEKRCCPDFPVIVALLYRALRHLVDNTSALSVLPELHADLFSHHACP